MTELSEIHADLRGLREQGASTTAAIAALDAGMTPIVCVGETLAEREAGAPLPL